MQTKPEYFRLHEEEDRRRFDKLDRAVHNLPCKEDIDKAVKEGIENHVNGKIDSLHTKLDAYIADDMKWKNTANPAVASYQKGSAFFSVLGAGTQFLLPLLGLIGIIYGFVNWLK